MRKGGYKRFSIMKSKKELKEDYRQMKFAAGLYQIRNTANGKCYLDVSNNLDAIWNRHLAQLKFGAHRNLDLQQDWQEYGASHFIYEIVDHIDTDDLTELQIKNELKALKAMHMEVRDPSTLYNR